MNNKKIIIGLSVTFLVILIGVAFWFFLTGRKSGPEIDNTSPFGAPGPQVNSETPFSGPLTSDGFSPPAAAPYSNSSRLNRVSDAPVVGGTIVVVGSTTVIRYMEKATGHIIDFDVTNGTRRRITNTTIPKITEALWGDRGMSLVARFSENDSIRSVFGFISSSTASTTSDGSGDLIRRELSVDMRNLSFSPTKKMGFYTLDSNAGIQGFITDKNFEKPLLVWSFPTKEWLVDWPNENTITLTTKAAHAELGQTFLLNPQTKKVTNILSSIPGLTTKTSPDGSLALYSTSKEGLTSLSLYDIKNKTSDNLEIKTLPEKCVWSGVSAIYCAVPQNGLAGEMPDLWYQGAVSFTDSLWKITLGGDGFEESELTNISTIAQGNIDLIDPLISGDGKILIFTNKIDSYLWALSI